MSSGERNAGWSGSKRERNVVCSLFDTALKRSSYECTTPDASQLRRHECSNQSPVIFFRRRTVPHTPPSFVKFRRQARGVIIGDGSSVPSSDHVPELKNALREVVATEATAEAVSWHAGAITGVPLSAFVPVSAPKTDPGSMICVNNLVGSPSFVKSLAVQERVLGST